MRDVKFGCCGVRRTDIECLAPPTPASHNTTKNMMARTLKNRCEHLWHTYLPQMMYPNGLQGVTFPWERP